MDTGTINFWIRCKDNPQFKSPLSNIQFCKDSNFEGILITVFKNRTMLNIDAKINNNKYSLNTDISSYLSDDIMVTITWTTKKVSLYINAEVVTILNW
jgi:hypothetical protein